MQPTLCSRCKKRVAVVFISKLENGKTVNEGLCLKCAKDLGLPQVNDMMRRMGITDDDLEAINDEMMQAFGGAESMEGLIPQGDDEADGDEEDGKTATFPFLNRLFNNGENTPAPNGDAGRSHDSGKERKGDKGQKAPKRKYLDSYCINLTQRAREGKLDNLVGREQEIERVIQILNRRQKNNPCLIGEPGVGKTAIAEGLAQRIANGDVPFKLRDKEVFLLDLTALVAGTQFRGQFESRMKGLIEEIRKCGNIILVIDEVHNIVGAGDAEGSMNAANILKPALSRGEIQVIGATTLNEYRKHIEKDTALERRFQPVTVNEPNLEDTMEILRGIAHYYETFHGVHIPDGILRQAVILSERYITDRYLPDKAIDLIDEACSDLNLHDKDINRRQEVLREIADYDKEREILEAAEEPNFERLAELKSRELQLQEELDQLTAKGTPELTMDNLARVIELWTKIPASKIREEEFKRLSELDQRLKKKIIGQDEAIDAVAAAIRRSRTGLGEPGRPIGALLFLGPTGVGKTALSKALARSWFGSGKALLKFDMSEYQEAHTVARLLGAPPGYLGHDEGGQLTEAVRRRPYSVVLFDEIEKAHPDIQNILLQLLEDGCLTDAAGRKADFTNTIVLLTANLGARFLAGQAAPLGFAAGQEAVFEKQAQQAVAEARSFFRPELLGRLDDTIVFRPLGPESLSAIADRLLGQLEQRAARSGYTLTHTPKVCRALAAKAASPYGARELRRQVDRAVEQALADRIASGTARPGAHYTADCSADGSVLLIADDTATV